MKKIFIILSCFFLVTACEKKEDLISKVSEKYNEDFIVEDIKLDNKDRYGDNYVVLSKDKDKDFVFVEYKKNDIEYSTYEHTKYYNEIEGEYNKIFKDKFSNSEMNIFVENFYDIRLGNYISESSKNNKDNQLLKMVVFVPVKSSPKLFEYAKTIKELMTELNNKEYKKYILEICLVDSKSDFKEELKFAHLKDIDYKKIKKVYGVFKLSNSTNLSELSIMSEYKSL